jgi:hypothetical protein
MADPRDIVDVSLLPRAATSAGDDVRHPETPRGQTFLRLWFRCANQYGRAYKSASGDCYLARCPTCMKTIRFGIGPGGTEQRFFEVSC